MMSLFFMIFSCIASIIDANVKTCTNINVFSYLVHDGKYLTGSEFQTVSNITFLVCVKHCQTRKRCRSINFQENSGDCVLNEGNTTNSALNFTNSIHSIYSDVDGWPNVLAGACASHTCPETTECGEIGTGSYDCVVVSCNDPPDVSNAQLATSNQFIDVGDAVPYVCNASFVPAGEITCLPNGTWSGVFQCLQVTSCSQVKTCNSSYVDGDYWIYLSEINYSLLKVYCYMMDHNSQDPVEFITLQGENFSVFPNKSLAENCGASWYEEYCGRTVFSKMRFNPWLMKVVATRYNFATTDCLHSPLGWAGDCSLCQDVAEPTGGTFRIDTSGTGIKVANQVNWISTNETLEPTVNKTNEGTVITGYCRGGCDYCKPATGAINTVSISVELDPTYTIDLSEATFPECSAPKQP